MKVVIIAAVDPILAYLRAQQSEMVKVTRRFVECESPTDDAAAVNRFADLVSDSFGNLASFRKAAGGAYGSHLFGELSLPGRRKQRRVLVLGHLDTVWPLGTLRAMPFRNESGRLWGPGVLDMKGGIVLLLFAARALQESGTPVGSRVWLQLNADEEVGSPSSRPLTEKNAAGAKAVLVLEPGTGLKGKLKTARKGVGNFEVKVHGKAAHAGLDFEAGASAIRELARQITRISTFSDLRRGITVNAGVISGGTRPNVVAAEARAEVDIRVKRVEDARALEKKFRTLEPYDARCSLEIRGGLNRPPMERSSGAADLFRLAKGLAQELGVELEESLSGGGSDGNFTAALGVPTLDGLGAVGEGAHALHESILIDRMADRAALLAKLLAAA